MIKVLHPRPGQLLLVHSRAAAGGQLAFMALFFVAWYSLILGFGEPGGASSGPFMLLFWIAPLFSVPEFIRLIRIVKVGERFTFTRESGTIARNGAPWARFSDVARIQIRRISGSESADEYRLSIVLKSDEKLRIDQASNENKIKDIAEEIADVTGVEITRKG